MLEVEQAAISLSCNAYGGGLYLFFRQVEPLSYSLPSLGRPNAILRS